LSKVFKDSVAFIPEKIVPGEIAQPPVWGEIIREVKSDGDHSSSPNTSPKISEGSDLSGDANGLSSLNSDFSSPDPQDTSNSTEYSSTVKQTPQVDVDAIAEEYFSKGIQEGIQRVHEDYASSIKTLQSICEELNAIRETILHNSAEEMRNLVLVIAEKIIRHSLSEQQQTILDTVNEALQKAIKTDEFVISVHPDDLETISSHSSEFIKSVNGLEKVIVKSDPSIEQGGCFIESSNCTIDATISNQLEIISDALNT
jgi:flagellar assembly protein FliH